jgi:rubrerythrin
MDDRLLIADGDVDTATIADYERSRRELVRRGMLAAGAALTASSVPILLGVRNAFAQADDDRSLLSSAIELEQVAAEAYQRLQGPLGGVARLFRNHERQHEQALTQALRQMGGSPPSADLEARLSRLPTGNRRAAANFAIELEQNAIRAYEDGARKLRDAEVMQTAMTILGAEAQHLVVLRQIAGQEPLPNAFELGR